MKVPKMYKSSDRYNAGTDVIYDDDSKLQYAPFVYATAESGDNGDDSGGNDDEEGDDTMVVKYDIVNSRFDKTWKEVRDASVAGKIVVLLIDDSDEVDAYDSFAVYYLTEVVTDDSKYYATFMGSYNKETIDGEPPVDIDHTEPKFLEASSPSDYLIYSELG